MGRKLMVLVGLAAALLMASVAMAGDFTIRAEAVECEVVEDGIAYTVEITVANDTGQPITDLKVQGGTAAWVSMAEWDDFEQAENPQAKKLPAKSDKEEKNQNVILVDSLDLADGADKVYTVVVQGLKPEVEDGEDCPNVLGNFTAKGQIAVVGEEEGEMAEIQAVAGWFTPVATEEEPNPESEPVYETPEILACDEAFACMNDENGVE
jgi:hypothetical protein